MNNQNKSFFYLLAAIVCVGYAVNFFFGKGKDENNENNESNEAIELVRQSKNRTFRLGRPFESINDDVGGLCE